MAMVGSAGRVVVPILVQQAIDRGLQKDKVNVGVVTVIDLLVALAGVMIALPAALVLWGDDR